MTATPQLHFTLAERRLIERLDTPIQVQNWLNRLPYNWERRGETARTFRGVVAHHTAHCLEAALSAATILEQHGFPPLIADIESVDLLDHVIYVYRQDGKWGSIGRSRCKGLHGRRPVYGSLRALCKSYSAPFIDTTGRVKGFGLLDLRKLPTGRWRLSSGDVWHVEGQLNAHQHEALPTPDAEFRKWKRRFGEWWTANGKPAHDWPDFKDYPDRSTWTAP